MVNLSPTRFKYVLHIDSLVDNVPQFRFNQCQIQLMRIFSRIASVYLFLLLFLYISIFVYMSSYNLQIIQSYCPHNHYEILVCFFYAIGVVSIYLAFSKSSFSLVWIFHIILIYIIYKRLNVIERINNYNLTESELDFLDQFTDKLFVVGECMIALKASIGVMYVTSILGFFTFSVYLIVCLINNINCF